MVKSVKDTKGCWIGGDELSRMSALVGGSAYDLHRMLGTLLRHVDELARSAFQIATRDGALGIWRTGTDRAIADLLDAVQNARRPVAETDKKKNSNV